jgi:hypothetical protein
MLAQGDVFNSVPHTPARVSTPVTDVDSWILDEPVFVNLTVGADVRHVQDPGTAD